MIDFGSAYTKAVAVNLETERIEGTGQSLTIVETDITIGLDRALSELRRDIGIRQAEFLAETLCSEPIIAPPVDLDKYLWMMLATSV